MNLDEFIVNETKKEYYKKIISFIEKERLNKNIFPESDDILKAFMLTPIDKIKVVILAQDPYHGKNQADGLAFSCKDNLCPKSLLNIKKELKDDLKMEISQNNSLENWAKQGVLLLNTILSVEEKKPLSHKNIGWEKFTSNIFKKICETREKLVFILWGNYAKKFIKYINKEKNLVINSSHPSFFSASKGFFGSKPFSKTNEFLRKNNIEEIDFKI